MAKVAVIFDTNSCRSKRETQEFFGERRAMQEIALHADILIPQIVIDELIQQNTEGTKQNIDSLKKNSLLFTLNFDEKELTSIDSSKHAKAIYEKEEIPHTIIPIKNTEAAFRKIERWSITGSAPFNERQKDGRSNSDKGFKDALIACTIDEILNDASYDTYYFACNDGRLKEYLRDNKKITCLETNEILEQLGREFFDEYTLSRAKEELDWPRVRLVKEWANINSDVVGLFEWEEYETVVIFDRTSKEIIESKDHLFIEGSDLLILSDNYGSTHDGVTRISESINYYNAEDLQKIRTGLTSNNQVYGIGSDDDVKALAQQIFRYFSYDLTDDEKKIIADYYGLGEESLH